jgi:hypothetical protein
MKLEDAIKMAEYQQHPLGAVWEKMDQDVFDQLVSNIKNRGLDKQIILYQGKILDGWHRYLACLAAGVTPEFAEFGGTELEAAELVHASGIRRQSSAGQRYASLKLLELLCPAFKVKYAELRAEGEQRQQAGKPLDTGAQRVDVVQARADAARVSKSTAKKVERVEKEEPDALADIAAGRTSANKVLKKLGRRKAAKKQTWKPNGDESAEAASQDNATAITCTARLQLDLARDMTSEELVKRLVAGEAKLVGLAVWDAGATPIALVAGGPLPAGCLAVLTRVLAAKEFRLE